MSMLQAEHARGTELVADRAPMRSRCFPAARRLRMLPDRHVIVMAALGALAAFANLERVSAQPGEPRINVAATIVAEPTAQTPISIQVGPRDALPSNSFIRVKGLPPSVSLTEGHVISPGSWAIPLFGLPSLKANIPAGVLGRTEVTISLVTVDGRVIAETRTALVVATLPSAEKAEPTPPSKQASAATPGGRPARNTQAPLLSDEDKARAVRFIGQGDKHLATGNVAAARDFYERAVEMGLAEAAIRLAATYDPSELQHFPVRGIVPDRAAARKWYERARELGASEAVERLTRLGGS
jgi:hypothetical protein